jgi:deoxyribodipyrimidine photo-lyase
MSGSVILWVRQCLRLRDNPALYAAYERASAENLSVIPVYIFSPEAEGNWPLGGASAWWLHRSLASLQTSYEKLGAPLILRKGSAVSELKALTLETQASCLIYDQRYEPQARQNEAEVQQELKALGVETIGVNTNLLFHPTQLKTGKGDPFKVYTPFWRSSLLTFPPAPEVATPSRLNPFPTTLFSEALNAYDLEPKLNWASSFSQDWNPGEAQAYRQLEAFTQEAISPYDTHRDIPSVRGTSRLSPHLHFGEISPRTIWHFLKGLNDPGSNSMSGIPLSNPLDKSGKNVYLKEIIWREFAYHLLYHFPDTPDNPLRPEFREFPWEDNPAYLKAWQRGMTGYPIVDAGMRELWTTGWMHNRVRMIVASFLVKHLRLSWVHGARWFWDTLLDADLASNTFGWQWSAGCGADAAPYFRIFNPILQGQKFDADGTYVKKWVPELAQLPANWVHNPWEAPPLVLHQAGIQLGNTYPGPIVDHPEARKKALAAFEVIKKKATSTVS